MISFTDFRQKLSAINRKKWIWIGLGFVAVLATHSYYVQEMLAALIIVSVLFIGASIATVAVFIVVRTSKPIIAWATPKILWIVHWSVDAGHGVIANQAWAQFVPRRFRKEDLKLKYKMVYIRFTGLKPSRVYRVGLRTGNTALTVGLSTQKEMANQLGNWLTQRVSFSDLIHLASVSHMRPHTRRRTRASNE